MIRSAVVREFLIEERGAPLHYHASGEAAPDYSELVFLGAAAATAPFSSPKLGKRSAMAFSAMNDRSRPFPRSSARSA